MKRRGSSDGVPTEQCRPHKRFARTFQRGLSRAEKAAGMPRERSQGGETLRYIGPAKKATLF